MNKNVSLIILMLIIIGGGIWVFFLFEAEQKEMAQDPLSDFQIKDTANIDKVVISEKDFGSIELNRNPKDNKWYINNTSQLAEPYNINLILETAYQIQVKQNIKPELRETAITQMAIRHTKVDYYFKGEDKPRKTWYVGNGTTDHMGTFMLLETYDPKSGKTLKSPEPFIMFKPGVYGTLDTRYFSNLQLWMYPGVFNYKLKDISKIEVDIKNFPQESYKIELLSDGKVSLLDQQSTPIQVFDSNAVKHYVTHYRELFYESFANYLTDFQKDSIDNVAADFNFTVTDVDGKQKNVRLWKIKEQETGFDLAEATYDTGRGLASINGSKEIVKVQFYTWDVLMKPLSYYLPKKTNPFQFKP